MVRCAKTKTVKATLPKLKYTLCLTVIMSVLWIGLKCNLYFSETDGVKFFWHWAPKIEGYKLAVWLLCWCALSTDLRLVTATVSKTAEVLPPLTAQCSAVLGAPLHCMLCPSLENTTLSVVILIVGSMWLITWVLPPISVTSNIPFNFYSYENHRVPAMFSSKAKSKI